MLRCVGRYPYHSVQPTLRSYSAFTARVQIRAVITMLHCRCRCDTPITIPLESQKCSDCTIERCLALTQCTNEKEAVTTQCLQTSSLKDMSILTLYLLALAAIIGYIIWQRMQKNRRTAH